MKMIRTTLLAIASLVVASTISAQQLTFMMGKGDDKGEYPSGSTFYIDQAKDVEGGAEIVFYTWLKPVPALVGTAVDFTITKLDHTGNTNWGISQLCYGLCTMPNVYDDVFNSTTPFPQGCVLAEYKKDTDLPDFPFWTNGIESHHSFKGDLIKAVDEYRVRYDFFKHGTKEKLASCNVNIKSWGGVSVSDINLKKVMMINEPGGACTLQYESEGRDLTLEVFDMTGNSIFRSAIPASTATYRLPVLLPPGVSIFRLSDSGKPFFTQKYLIK